jgi:hypothetical protein
MNTKYLIPLACIMLSLAVLSAAISPRFNERAYDLLQDSATNRQYFNNWARYYFPPLPQQAFALWLRFFLFGFVLFLGSVS